MKNRLLLISLLLLFCGGRARGQCSTTTPNIGMTLPAINQLTGWGTCLNTDLTTLDSLLGGSGTLAANSTTPSVANHFNWQTADTSATAVTNLTGGYPGQVVRLFCADTNMTMASGANLALTSAFSCANAKSITLVLFGSVWTEMARSPGIGTLPGTNGQLLFNNGGILGAEDPVVSQPTASLLNATVVQGNAGSNAQAWWTQIGDTSHGPAAVKAASTAAVAADLALVVAISPNNSLNVTTTPPANASTNITQWNSVALGSPSAYGTSPGAVNVPGVNAFITNQPTVVANAGTGQFNVTCTAANCPINEAQWGGTALGTPTNFGTTPGAVVAGSVNASLFSGTTALGTPNTFGATAPTGNALGVNASLFLGTALATANSTTTTSKTALDTNILSILGTAPTTPGFLDIKGADGNVFVRQATAANLNATVVFPSAQPVSLVSTTITGNVGVTQSTSPWVDSITTWGGGTLGAMANYGTSPGAVLVPGVNAFITNTPTVTANQGGAPWSDNVAQIGGVPISLGQAASKNSVPVTLASDQPNVPVVVQNLPLNQNVSVVNTALSPVRVYNQAPLQVYAVVNGILVPVQLTEGQAVMTQSLPVVISSNQSPVPVSNAPVSPSLGNGPAGAQQIAVDNNGVLYTRPQGLPKPPCNAILTTNCQHF